MLMRTIRPSAFFFCLFTEWLSTVGRIARLHEKQPNQVPCGPQHEVSEMVHGSLSRKVSELLASERTLTGQFL